jgi:hypothetical protein
MRTESSILYVLMRIVPSFSFEIMHISPASSFISAASIRMSVFGFFCLTTSTKFSGVISQSKTVSFCETFFIVSAI